MDRILLVGINARYSHSNPALLYLKKSIEPEFSASVAEFTIAESAERIADQICAMNPGLLGISVYIWNSLLVKKILKPVKLSLPGVKIVLGGPEVSYSSGDWISEFDEIDWIITGAGEASFRELLLSGCGIEERVIPGNNPHFSLIKFPYTSGEMERLKGKYLYYESSRGCSFNCSYCLSSVRGRGVEFRNIEQVKEEIDFFLEYNPRLVKFVDRTFNLKKSHYLPVWEHIVKRSGGSGTSFHFEIFPELLDDEDLSFLKTVPRGLFQFEMGIQSMKPETLGEINRSGRRDRLEANIKSLADHGNIHLHTDLIAGLPFESFTDYRKSFNSVYSLGAEHLQGGFLKVLPGTVMRDKTEEYRMEYNTLPPYEIISNRWITSKEIERLKLISELVDLLHNGGRFPETVKSAASIYQMPFDFYNRLADFFSPDSAASHRKWEYIAGILITMVNEDHRDKIKFLTDCLRWDWCCTVNRHHYPEMLKSDATVEAKRTGFRFFKELSDGNVISYGGVSFTGDQLRRSIFFAPESEEFKESKMKDKMAVFLPDKKVLFFNPDNTPDKK